MPPGAQTALDIGTGNGLLAAELADAVPHVTGIDADAEVLRSARAEAPGVEFVHGDVLTHSFEPESFDIVGSVRRELPGATFRLLPMWRYVVVWHKSGERSAPA